jgi:hypothetical protein
MIVFEATQSAPPARSHHPYQLIPAVNSTAKFTVRNRHETYPRPRRMPHASRISPHAKSTSSSWDLVGGGDVPDCQGPSAGSGECLPAAGQPSGGSRGSTSASKDALEGWWCRRFAKGAHPRGTYGAAQAASNLETNDRGKRRPVSSLLTFAQLARSPSASASGAGLRLKPLIIFNNYRHDCPSPSALFRV